MSAGKMFPLPETFPPSTQKIKGFKKTKKSTSKVIELKPTYSTALKAMPNVVKQSISRGVA